MMEPFVAEIKIFAGNFAPQGWFFCDGSLLPIAQYSALFSLLGTTYGGNGQNTFALPDLRGRVPMHAGAGQPGPGLPAHSLGEMGGSQTNTLTAANLPAHVHNLAGTAQLMVKNANADAAAPAKSTVLGIVNDGQREAAQYPAYATGTPDTTLNDGSIGGTTGIAGSNVPVNNMQPYLALNYIIAWQGIYPSRP
ncbi:MAG: phage tail protein [Chitinophagaceae bacterium]|nr:MAG: phage tail protein [Chitinophagaceae bacterium]